MKDKKILYISSEVVPYLPHSELSNLGFEIPKMVNDRGGHTRIFIPKYGLINERRHQLHEVIRLSGMNLVINDIDMPLIIKVASIPKERMQVYFIDNDDYFKGRGLHSDDDGSLYADNDERAIFFAKGVIETVKKLNWSPDIIHLHGWFTSLFPLYLKTYYKDEPLFAGSKIISSLYRPDFNTPFSKNFHKKVIFDKIDPEHIEELKKASYEALSSIAIKYSDGVIISDEKIPDSVVSEVKKSNKPILDFNQSKDEEVYIDFYSEKF